MPQASITINAVVGSDTDLPINTLVQLDNQNIGGELSYLWEILDQPPGAADSISLPSIQNPTFTPKKEGTYLIQLTVNLGLVTEQTQTVVAAVSQLKTLERIPAAGEVLEADTADGWASSMNSLLRRVDLLLSDPGIIVGVNASGGNLTRGQVVRCTAASVIKSTLPGQETVPGFTLATAATLAEVDELLAVVEGTPADVATVANLGLMKVRYIGRIAAQVIAGGAVAVGDTIFVDDTGALSNVAGTIRRRVGSAMTAGAAADVWFNGVGGADIDLTPIDRAYLVHGAKGALVNAVRTDGASADPSTVGFRFSSGAVGTVPLTAKGFAGQTADLFQWLNSADGVLMAVDSIGRFVAPAAGAVALRARGVAAQTASIFEVQDSTGVVLASFDKDGDLVFADAARRVEWPVWFIEQGGGNLRFMSVAGAGADYVHISQDPAQMDLKVVSGGAYAGLSVFGVGALDLFSSHAMQLRTFTGPISIAPEALQWEFRADGSLMSWNKSRIVNVARPTTAADAVSTEYLGEVAKVKNALLNSGFDFWQRDNGAGVTPVHLSGAGVYNRAYGADRWYAAVTSTVGADNAIFYMQRGALANGLIDAQYEAQFGPFLFPPNAWTGRLVQEVDRDEVLRLRGKVVNASIWLRNPSLPAGCTYELKLISGTGPGNEHVTRVGGYTGVFLVASGGVLDVNTLTATFARKTAQGTVPAGATTLAFVIEVKGAGGVGGGELCAAGALLSESAAGLLPAWERRSADLTSELQACEAYFQKSWDLALPVADVTQPGLAPVFHHPNVAVGNNTPYLLGKHIEYRTRMRACPSGSYLSGAAGPVARLYNPYTGALGTWDFSLAGGAGPANPVSPLAGAGGEGNTSETGCNVWNMGGGAIGAPGADTLVHGHWAVDAEI